jgi:hypothetical protein
MAKWAGAFADSDAAMKDVHRAVDEARAAREARWDKESLGRAASGILPSPEPVEAPTQPELEAWPPRAAEVVEDVPEICGCDESTTYLRLLDEVSLLERLSGEYQTDGKREVFRRLRRAIGWRDQRPVGPPEEHEQPNDARPDLAPTIFDAAGLTAEQAARSLAVPRPQDAPSTRQLRREVSALALEWITCYGDDIARGDDDADRALADLFYSLAEVLR